MTRAAAFVIGLCCALVAPLGCRSYSAEDFDSPAAPSAPGAAPVPDAQAGGAPASTGRNDAEIGGDRFDEARRDIERARTMPMPAGNYRVDVERIWLAENESFAIDAMFEYADENWNVSGGALPAPGSGLRVGVAKGNFSAGVNVALRNAKHTTREQITLVTVADYAASIDVGQVRYAAPFGVPGIHGVVLFPAGQLIGTSLSTIVRRAGSDQVVVSLTPVFSALEGGGETVAVTRLTTTVQVPLGQPLLIANHDRTHDDVETTLFSRTTATGREQAVLVLRVTGG